MTSPLLAAIAAGERQQVRRLLSEGADPNIRNDQGESALTLAAAAGDTAMVKDLLAAGADRDYRGQRHGLTALELSASYGHRGILALLLPLADLDVSEPDTGRTVLHLAVVSMAMRSEVRAQQILSLLLAAGADPTRQDHAGQTPLDLARQSGHTGRLNLLSAHQDTTDRS